MKTKKNLLVACFVGLALTVGIAGTALAGPTAGSGIVGSKHDMNSYSGGAFADGDLRVCAFCHTPHHATVDVSLETYMPLWSRTVNNDTFTTYDSDTLDATLGGHMATDALIGPSRLCMSCHDGAIAIDAYYGNPTPSAGTAEGDAYGQIGVGLGSSISNDHPVGFDYDGVQGDDAEIIAADGRTFGGGTKTIADVLWTDFVSGTRYMTCASCHDVHNSTGVVEDYFLYGAQAESALCTTCHNK